MLPMPPDGTHVKDSIIPDPLNKTACYENRACEISDDEYSDDEEAAYLHVFAKEVI